MRYVYLILFAFVLGVPFVLRWATVHGRESDHVDKNAARLIVVTAHNGDIRREFGRAFDAWHREHYGQSVVIDYRVPGGTTDMVRFLRNQPVGPDMVWGGGDFTYAHDLQPFDILQPMPIDPALLHAAFPQDTLAGVRLYDATKSATGTPTPQWIGVVLSSFGIVYNSELYSTLGLSPPLMWNDLTNPNLFGLIALADPAHSGSAAVAYMMVLQRAMADAEQEFLDRHADLKALSRGDLKKRGDYHDAIAAGWKKGMGQLLLIAANARYFTDSSEVVPTDVGRGEAAAGMAIDFYARVTEGTVGSNRARFVAPHAATAITPDAIAILHGVTGTQLTLAMHFVEFLLSDEGQRLWILRPALPGGPIERSPRRMPIRPDVYADQSGWADHFNPFDEAGGFNQRGEWMALMTDIRPIWDVAWIDSRDALIAAYRKILRVQDPARRARLLDQLADLPVTMRDIENRRDERTRLENEHADVYDWQARQRINWADVFRNHYRAVASQAQ
jgi:ABC-type Fe3+ transport system substrate-binding protein